jgi:hypothetical protein
MKRSANFRVDARLASLLGEGYRSSEEALKELVDNAWDADSEKVIVSLPNEMTSDPVIIEDDGSGMTEAELREEYLVVASDRRTRKGDFTAAKRRRVKGRKGIGKFAGLLVAKEMTIETCARGKRTRVRITKQDLLANGGGSDLDQIPLPIETDSVPLDQHGTKITLAGLNQALEFPSPERLRQLLILEYGRQDGFEIIVNDQKTAIDDIPGTTVAAETPIQDVGSVRIKFTVADGSRTLKQHGIVIRVGGKMVGPPSMFGLEQDEVIPPKLLRKVYGEIEADGLASFVTADWGAIVQNSKPYQAIQKWAAEQLRSQIEKTFRNELNLARGRLKLETKRRLEALPENRRRSAQEAVERIFARFYGEKEERIETVVNITLDAFERDEYWVVFQKLQEARHSGVARLSEGLNDFGLVDLANMAQVTRARLQALDHLEALIFDDATRELDLHQAIVNNLWIFGPEYHLLSSNRTLATLVDGLAETKKGQDRPDLFLAQTLTHEHVLIEFKRPKLYITRDHEAQARKYRDALARQFSNIRILLIGRGRHEDIPPDYISKDVTIMSYVDLISRARAELSWILENLQRS